MLQSNCCRQDSANRTEAPSDPKRKLCLGGTLRILDLFINCVVQDQSYWVQNAILVDMDIFRARDLQSGVDFFDFA